MGPFKVFLDHPNEKSVTATSINLNLSTSEPHFVFQISLLSNIAQKWFCMQNVRRDLCFQEKKNPIIGSQNIKQKRSLIFLGHPVGMTMYDYVCFV